VGPTAAVHPADSMLQAYGLGKLDDVASASVSKHVEECDSCQRRVAELSSDDFLGRLPKVGGIPDKSASGWLPSAASATDGAARPTVPPPSVDTLPPELVDHPDYEIVRELGRGGMGVVYLANNKLMGRLEVLKFVGRHLIERPGVADRFLREIRSAAKLQHPNIVAALSALRFRESLVLAMEYVEGLDLAKMVKTTGPLPIANACYFIHQAALGLQHAHERGMVHRDIKPANLILARDGKKAIVKVLDFGLAKVTSEGQTESNLTREGQMLGTPDYIAPEQIRNAQSADIRADIYSLGCTFYYLLTGGPPFRGDHLWDVYQAHFSMEANPLNLARPEVPVELAAVAAKMMAKEPGRRFQTPGEVARALAPFFKRDGATGSTPELSVVAQHGAGLERSDASQAPIEPATRARQHDTDPKKPVAATRNEPQWESLIAIKETERSAAVAPALVAMQQPSWLWPSAVIGFLMFGLFVAWMCGVFKVKTPEGIIVLENLPKDAHVFVDGRMVTLQTIDGREFAITVAAGKKQRLQVQKDGFTTFGEELEIDAGGRQSIAVRLEPLPVATANPAGASVPVEKSAAVEPIVKKTDYDAIATGKWISVLERKMDLRDKRVLIPEQSARDVIIRARVKKVTGQNLGLDLRCDEGPPRMRGYSAWFNGGNWFGIYKGGEGPHDLVQWHAHTKYDDYFEFAFSAVGETLTIYADGKRIGEIRDPQHRQGFLRIGAHRGRAIFEDIEIMILDKSVPLPDGHDQPARSSAQSSASTPPAIATKADS
jgi:serine/threonine protein kinase